MEQIEYTRTVVPSSMRSSYWKYFGFPSDNSNNILTRQKIVCTICNTAIAYNKNTSNLRTHLTAKHPEVFQKLLATKRSSSEGDDSQSDFKITAKEFPNQLQQKCIDRVNASVSDVQCEKFDKPIDEISEDEKFEGPVDLLDSLNQADAIPHDVITECQEQKNEKTLENMLADMIRNDLLPISLMTGEGFRTYNQQVSGVLLDEELYQQVKDNLRLRILDTRQQITKKVHNLSQTSPFSLSIEVYINSDDLNILNIYFNFLDETYSRLNSILYKTKIGDNDIDLFETLKDVNLTNCKCIVINNSAHITERIANFAKFLDMEIIECLATTLERCLQKIFQLPVLVRKFSELHKKARNHQSLNPPLLKASCSWSKLNFLAHVCEQIEDSKWDTLSEMKAIYQYIKPMKLALDIIGDEQLPSCALSQPLVVKLFEQHFSEPQTNPSLIQIQDILESDLKSSIRQSPFLLEATYFDARFKHHFVLPEAPFDLKALKTKVIERFKNMIDIHYIARSTKIFSSPELSTTSTRTSNLKAFFDNTDVDATIKCALHSSRTNLDEEFEKYHVGVNLDLEQSTVAWWQSQTKTFNELSKIIFYYLVTPCCCVHPLFNVDVDQRWQKLNRRKQLNYFCDIEQNLWYLHYNDEHSL